MLLSVVVGCKEKRQSQSVASDIRDFTVSIEGTSDLELDLLLITKPSSDSIERETTTVKVPFSKSFRAVKCVVWIDQEFRGKAGKYRVVLKEHGKPFGEHVYEGRSEEGHKRSARLGML